MTFPLLSVWTEEVDSVRRVQELLSGSPLQRIESAESATKTPLLVRASPTILVLSVQTQQGADTAILADGESLAVASSGELITARLPLAGDVERHLITVVTGGEWIAIFEVRVEVWRAVTASSGAPLFYAPKWTRSDVDTALSAYDEWRAERAPRSAGLDTLAHGLARAGDLGGKDAVQALYFEAHRLARIVFGLRAQDLLEDYAYEEDPELDVESTLELLRAHPSWLVAKPEGRIAFRGKRYSTPAVSWQRRSIGRLDLTVLLHLVEVAIAATALDQRCQGAALILRSVLRRMERLNSARRSRPSMAAVDAWLAVDARTARTRALKTYLIRVSALAKRLTARTWSFGTTEGLGTGARDFDLFQWWCGRCLCNAFGAALPTDATTFAVEAGEHTIFFPDRAGGQEAISGILTGWRDGSDQPSDYRPDFVVHYGGATPIIIDAKFRAASSVSRPASSSSFKDVQAYLDEFGAQGAIVMVPTIPRRLVEPDANVSPWLIEGQSNEMQKRMFVVECAPSLDPSEAIRTAVEALAN